MSFLDATGLGTFWSKLKNYFVPKTNFEAPVTGLTDILTPVNLMPNSDFSRGTGLTYPIEIASMGSSFITFANYWQIQCYAGSCSNVSLTVDKDIGSRYNLLHIYGTVTSVSTDSDGIKYIILRIRNTNNNYYRNDALWYTDTFKLEKVDNQSYTLSGSAGHSGSEGGAIRTTGLNVINIFRTSGANTLPYFTISLTNINVGDTFQIRVYDCATYLGGYRNPPIMPSLDNMPGNQFMLRSYTDYPIRRPLVPTSLKLTNIGGNEWFRVARLNDNDNTLECIGTFILGSTSGDNFRGKIFGTFCIFLNTGNIKVLTACRHKNSGTTLFSKLRIVSCTETDGTTGYYLEAYSNVTSNNNTYVSCCLKILDSWVVSASIDSKQINLGKIPSGITETAITSEVTVTYDASY